MLFQTRSTSPLQAIGCLLTGSLIMFGIFTLAKAALSVVWWLCAGFFIAALVIDWTVVRDAGNYLVRMYKQEPLRAFIFTVLGAICFPLLAFFLFLGALAKRKMKGVFAKFQDDFKQMGGTDGENPFMTGRDKPKQDDYVDYEEVESKRKDV